MKAVIRCWAVALVALVVCSAGAFAQEDKKSWTNKTDLSYVLTAGNAQSSSFGFKNDYLQKWDKSRFELNVAAINIRTGTTIYTLTEADNDAGFTQSDDNVSATTAESYFLGGRFDRDITKKFFWYAAASWYRNQFSGFNNRYVGSAGVGNLWKDTDKVMFRTDYAVTYTDQDDINPNPTLEESFAGIRLSYDYRNKFTESTEFESQLIFDYNVDVTEDWRSSWLNSVSVVMTKRLALKVALALLYANEPALADPQGIVDDMGNPVYEIDGDPTSPQLTARPQLEELDTIFTTSLVINF